MLHATAASILAAAESGPAKSKTAFYILGGVLAVWAVVISAVGITQPEFPGKPAQARAVMAFTALLVIAATASAVATS
jgi:hypothetical protein